MRKISSFLLMAAALLIGTQAQAGNVSSEKQLRDAIVDAPAGATVDIKLSNDIQLTSALQIYAKKAEAGKTINLDLNGKTLSNNGEIQMIQLFKGTLNISNGTINCTSTTKDAISVYGVYEEIQPLWSVLNVGKDVRITSAFNAITVLEFWGTQYYAYADRAFAGKVCDGVGSNAGPLDSTILAYKYNSKGDSLLETTQSDSRIALAKSGLIDYTSSYPYYSDSVIVGKNGKNPTTYSKKNYTWKATAWAKANGVVVNVSGYVYGAKYGIKVNGTLRHASKYQPTINVLSTAEIACSPEPYVIAKGKESIALYCSGVANYNISGYVHGSIGVVVKGGEVNIDNATIVSDDDTFTSINDMPGSGVDGGRGNALVVYSDGGDVSTNSGYAGGQNVTITGDTKLSSDAGFSILEFTNPGDDNQLGIINIQGGTFESGDQGVMAFTSDALDNNKVVIVGGNVGEGAIYKDADEVSLDSLINNDQQYITTIEVGDEKTFIVNSGSKPAAVAFDQIPANGSAEVAEGVATLSESKKFGDLQFLNNTKVTITDNAVMEVGSVIMSAGASIIITPGAKLIVNGSAGIYAPVDSNIVVKADASGMGYFILNPSVASNRTPHATVEYYAKNAYSMLKNQVYGFDIIVSPFSAMSSIDFELDASDINTAEGQANISLQIWKNNKWVFVKRADAPKQLQAFQPIAMTSTAMATKGCKFIFKGELQGNVSGLIPVGKNYNYMGNAYLAPMSSEELIKILKANDQFENSIHVWKEQGFKPVTMDEVLNAGNIAPLNIFILKSKGSVNLDMNYEKLIWNLNQPQDQ